MRVMISMRFLKDRFLTLMFDSDYPDGLVTSKAVIKGPQNSNQHPLRIDSILAFKWREFEKPSITDRSGVKG
ncbi:hypothetical protein JTE90_015052 [Oedothorax gibbosus]|uniref:Uncharacterized protein n=1 Tax=Oedothorax gibbosus TaxID=931172 RepID=A0AAV6TP50_9ARAC|nr:hypothetical protein JTE90_015052 [Oedothorax gibbosus]